MEPSTTSFKDNEKPAAADPTRGIGHPPEVYPPPPHYGGGYPPAGYAPPPPMPGYGGHPSPPPPYGGFPPPYNTGPYTPPPQAYGYPHHPPPAYSYAPPPGYQPAANAPTKKKKKSGMSKILGMGAGLVGGVVGGLLLGELAADGGAAAPSFELFSDPTGGGMDYNASMQSMSNSMDTLGTIG
ncbi:unnamed protein product [Citrullus colocynthis]|uniref:Uncharacterized protein n=1 Tax=Citrullus colocynthis TaxID=252529 RepID=A0ABP0Z8D0_9ROSI